MKITTKTGDRGQTSLFGGRRVSKNNFFIELVGELDELQSLIGWCRCAVTDDDVRAILDHVQNDLYRMMSIVGFEMKCPANIQPISEKDVEFLEKAGEKCGAAAEDLKKFIRPCTTEMAARLHVARTVCRRAERAMVSETEKMPGDAFFKYLNRLSDLFFVLAYRFEVGLK